jgi:AAA domain
MVAMSDQDRTEVTMKPTAYTNITPEEPEWLWRGKIPLDEVTVIAGDGGIGKGFLLADIAARVTRGDDMPDGTASDAPAGSVLLVTSEDDPNMAMSWRLRAAGADLARVYDMTDDFTVPESLPALREAIDAIGNVRLVTIDPLSAVSSIALTSSNVRVRRQIMTPLERIAKQTGVAVVVVHHTVKSGRVAGTKGITDAARQVLKVSRSVQDDRIRLIHVDKSNIASDAVADTAYTVTGNFPDVGVRYLAAPVDAEGVTHTPRVADIVLDTLKQAALKGKTKMEAQEIAHDSGADYGAVRTALTRLKRDNLVYSPAKRQWALEPTQLTTEAWQAGRPLRVGVAVTR